MSWSLTPLLLPMQIMGLGAWKALAIAVTVSVTPGPAVTTATPGVRVTRDQPSAAWPATARGARR